MKRIIFVLLVFTLLLVSSCSKTINWPEGDLGKAIPKLEGSIKSASDYSDSISITLKNISKSQFLNYIEECKNAGFTIEADEDNTSYTAFNEDGYKLEVSYWSNEDIQISVEAPMEMSTFSWPKSEIAKLLPIPNSTYGIVKWEEVYGFVIYVGNTPKDDYVAYVDAVYEVGFTENYSRSDNYFRAYNKDGYSVNIDYKGFNIMLIRLDEPKKEESSQSGTDTITNISESNNESSGIAGSTDESTNSNNSNDKITTDNSTNSNTSAEELIDGMRPSFKEAMDSYEKFFDEYCEFMKKYSTSNDTTSMLSDYLSFLTRYAEVSTKMEKLGEEDLNTVELNYYLQVTERINKKLLEIA